MSIMPDADPLGPLTRRAALHLDAAEGWLELGNPVEANQELEKITPQLQAHPDVLQVRWNVYAKTGKWEACADIAQALCKLVSRYSVGFIHLAYSLHEMKLTKEARRSYPWRTSFLMNGRFRIIWPATPASWES